MPKPKKTKATKSDKKAIQDAFKYFEAQDREAEKNRPKITNKEKLIFLFKTLIKSGWRNGEGVLIVPFDKIMVEPYFYPDDMESVYLGLPYLFKYVQTDKDFYRKHNMSNYEPTFAFDTKSEYSNLDDLIFKDFTDDFLKEYLEDRLGVKYSSKNKSGDKTIQKIEVVEPKSEWDGITMYINSNYANPIKFKRGKYINLFYTLAQEQGVRDSNRGFISYFNSNNANPLYEKTNFNLSKILTQNGDYIEPSIPILLKTQKSISQAKNKKLKSA